MSFILTLVATFVGVFLAIDLTNRTENNKEEKEVINILEACYFDLNNKLQRANVVHDLAEKGSDSIYSIRKLIENNPLQLPTLFQSTVNNPKVLSHLSKNGIQQYNLCADNILSLHTAISKGVAKNDSILLATIPTYIKQMEFAKNIIALEKTQINGEISEEFCENMYNELLKDLVGNGPHDIDTAINQQKEREKKLKGNR